MSDRDARKQGPLANRRFLLAAAVVAILVLLAVIIVVTQLVPGHRTTADPTSTPSASSSATPTDADPSSCGLAGYETRNTLSGPPETNWELVGTVAAPTSPKTGGPGVVESNGFRFCFAHTAEGALFASANLLALVSDTNLLTETAEKLVLPGPGQQALLTQAGSGSRTPVRYQISGYHVDAYSATRATVDVAVNLSTGEILSFPIQLKWSSGDWKAIVTADGSFALEPAQLQSLAGYTVWSGA